MKSKPFARRNNNNGTSNGNTPDPLSVTPIPTPPYLRPSILLPLVAILVVASWNLFIYTKTAVNTPELATTTAITTMPYKVEAVPSYFVGKRNTVNITVHFRDTSANTDNTTNTTNARSAQQSASQQLVTHQYVIYSPNTGLDDGSGISGQQPTGNVHRVRVSGSPQGGAESFIFPVTTTGNYDVYIEDANNQQHHLYRVKGIGDPLSNPVLIVLLVSFALMVGFFRKMFRRERNFTFLFIYATVLMLICFGIFGIVSQMADYKKPKTGVNQIL